MRYGLQPRVVIVLPPCDQDAPADLEALGQTGVLLALLEDSGTRTDQNPIRAYEYELALGDKTLVVKWSERSGVKCGSAVPAPKGDVCDSTYIGALAEALTETDRELSELTFDARYPW